MGKMKFLIDPVLAHKIFDEKSGGITNFTEEWASTSASEAASAQSQRSTKTIYAWLKNGLPASRDTVFSFFGALDVDPTAMVDLEKSEIPKIFGRLRHAFMMGGVNAGSFQALFDIYRPSANWPDDSLSQRFYSRDWTNFDFDHPADKYKNGYVTITVRGDESVSTGWPRAFHIAYRRHSNADGLWRPYGTVVCRFGKATLAHENGDIQHVDMPPQSKHHLQFKTYFGPGPAEFRIACLHPFAGEIEQYDDLNVPLYFVA
tara:strand:- start:36201 stop:36980 length:780 start_codon:yes stop_codon:yes gene_type:complete